MAMRRSGISADYLGGDPRLAGPVRGRLSLDRAHGLRFAGRDGSSLAVEPADLEAAGVVERPAGGAPLGRRLRMMAAAGDWDTGRLRVLARRGTAQVALEFLVVSVDAGTELSRYNGEREKRGEPLLPALGLEEPASAAPAPAQDVEDG
jgi:hypothetical protein